MIIVKPVSRHPRKAHVFLAGGISNCPDWQSEAEIMLSTYTGVAFNPRRPGELDPAQAEEQIEWEFKALEVSETVLFWFPKETLCPITLFELGVWSHSSKKIYVGAEPEYSRRIDVVKQMQLARPEITVYASLEETVAKMASENLNALIEETELVYR